MCGALPPTLFGGFLRTGALFVTTGSLVGRFWYVGTMLGRIWEPLGRFLGFFWVPWEQQGNHSSWGNGPRATILPRGMVRLGTNMWTLVNILGTSRTNEIKVWTKNVNREAQEVPKGTIPLGGMVAQGPFPQEEWFPRFNFGAILCECIMVKQSLWQYALGLKQSLRHELEWRKGGGLQPRLRTFAI